MSWSSRIGGKVLRMTKLPQPQPHWDLVTAALNGALLGLLVAVTRNYVDAFYVYIPREDLVLHILSETAFCVSAGAMSLAIMAGIHNWLRRDQ
jgi:hypothetical protein